MREALDVDDVLREGILAISDKARLELWDEDVSGVIGVLITD